MSRSAFILRVREGMVDEYRRLHNADNLWPSIIYACQRAGMRNYTGFIGGADGRTVFATFEADDPAHALQRLSADLANAEWQAHMAPYLETEVSLGSGSALFLEEVFHIG